MMPRCRRMQTVAVTLLMGACAPPPDTDMSSVHDTTGVQIVENTAPAWHEGRAWRIDPEPIAQLGGDLNGEGEDLFAIKAIDRLSDRRIIIAHAGNHVIQVHDSLGRFLYGFGQKGPGPAEFRFIDHLAVLPGDTIVVMDAPDFRVGKPKLMRFLADGTFVDRREIDPEGRMNIVNTNPAFTNGFRVQKNGKFIIELDDSRTVRSGETRSYSGSAVVDRVTSAQDTIGWFPGLIHIWPRRRDDPTRIRRFSPMTSFSFGEAAIFIGDSKTYEIGRYSLDGKLEKLIRRDVRPQRVRDEDMEALLDRVAKRTRQSNPDDPNAVEQAIDRVRTEPRGNWKPVFSEIRGDTDGNLWVQDYDDASLWSVFDTAGVYLGAVKTPEGERLYRIEQDFVFTEIPDADGFGLQRFRLYRLVKPE